MQSIDPEVTKQDSEFLRMTPDERYQHLMRQGHAFPTREQCTDEGVAEWFDDLGAIGQERLRLATEGTPIAPIRRKELMTKIAQAHINMGEELGDLASHNMDLSDIADRCRKRGEDKINRLKMELDELGPPF